MQYSGIIVTVVHEALVATVGQLETLPGLEVHHVDSGSNRIVVVHEGDGAETPEDTFRKIQDMPGVITVDLASYVVDSDDSGPAAPTLDAREVPREMEEQGDTLNDT